MRRPRTFDDIIGHKWLVSYFTTSIANKTLPHFIILEGPEGLGKTSLADLIALNLVYSESEQNEIYNSVICTGDSNSYIKHYKLSVEGGKDAAKEVLAEMHDSFTLDRPKVLICDECHGLSDAAQDVFLADTEFIVDNIYVIMLTTEITRLKASLRSRAVPFHLDPLTHAEMLQLLHKEVIERNLNIQNLDITLSMIADWADNRPRTALNILKAFSNGQSVSTELVRGLIGTLDVKDVIPLIASLSGSMTFGLSFISEMQVNNTLIGIVSECIKIKQGQPSYKISMNDLSWVRDQLRNVTDQQLIKFLFGLTKHQKLDKTSLINAYIGAHNAFDLLVKPDTTDVHMLEIAQQARVLPELDVRSVNKAPTLDDLMLDSDVIC